MAPSMKYLGTLTNALKLANTSNIFSPCLSSHTQSKTKICSCSKESIELLYVYMPCFGTYAYPTRMYPTAHLSIRGNKCQNNFITGEQIDQLIYTYIIYY